MEDAPGVAVKTFSESFLGQNVHFYVLRLKESFLLWVGTEATFKTLAVAMNIKLTRVRVLYALQWCINLWLTGPHCRMLNQPVLSFWVTLLMFHQVT